MELTTVRLRVRPFAAGDEAPLAALLADPAVMEFLEPPFLPAQAAEFLRTAGLSPQPLIWAVERRADGAFVGYLIFHPYPGSDAFELGWVLARDAWGQGFAAELTEAVIAHSRRAGIPALILECDPAQTATRRLAARFGFAPQPPADGLLQFRLEVGCVS